MYLSACARRMNVVFFVPFLTSNIFNSARLYLHVCDANETYLRQEQTRDSHTEAPHTREPFRSLKKAVETDQLAPLPRLHPLTTCVSELSALLGGGAPEPT